MLESIAVRGNDRTQSGVIEHVVPFRTGEPLDVSDQRLGDLRFRLLATGFFDDVRITLERGTARGRVVLVITVRERNTFTIEQLAIGVSEGLNDPRTSGAAVYAGGSVAETNLLGTGSTLAGAFLLSAPQQAIRMRFYEPSLFGSPLALSLAGFFASGREAFGNGRVLVAPPLPPDGGFRPEDAAFAIVRYHRGGAEIGSGLLLDPTVRFDLRFHVEAIDVLSRPDAASELRGSEVRPIDFHIRDGTSIVTALTLELSHDARDDVVIPREGRVLHMRADLGTRLFGGDYDYVRVQALYREWISLPEWEHTLRLSLFAGAALGDAPFFSRFYAADLGDLVPGRILDMSIDRRGAPNLLGTAIGAYRIGELGARLDVEYAIAVARPSPEVRSIWIFANAGLYLLADSEIFLRPTPGYVVSVPLDLTFDAGVRIETAIGVFSIGLSTLFGFVSF